MQSWPSIQGPSKAPDAPTGASFSDDVRQHVRFAQLQQKLGVLSTMDNEDLDDHALLEAARKLGEHSSSMDYCCSGLDACRSASTPKS